MMLWHTLCVITVLSSLQSSGSIQWPAGTYGIPKPISGCPRADGFRWQTGWRLQYTNYYDHRDKSNNSRSSQFHIDGKVNKVTVNRSFCIKGDTADEKNRSEWPRGKYCIYKGDTHCPKGLTPGWVFWNDNEEYDLNKKDGFLPDGVYETFTEIHFCCTTDGDKDEPIVLPTRSPFFLLAYESAKCQMVKWAVASLEWIYYFTTDEDNNDQRNGSYPYNAGKKHPTIYYCYYQGCEKTLTAVSGTLNSPNYPKHYPDGQYCSWRIIANTTEQIHLVFKSFSLQNERLTDELRVYDGEDETGEELGVFYGGHPPPKEGIYSSSSRMFLIFKSDKTHSYTGFSASYFPGKKPGCNATLTAVNGTFQSPNYPRNYPDGQYCFWRITVVTTQQICLLFSSFSLQNENNTDALYVYDGENATGEALEVFYGGHPPPKEGICISSNRIFVVFYSDKAGSYHGFSASYYGVNNSVPRVTTTKAQIPAVTSSSTLTISTTQTSKVTSSPVVPATTAKTLKVTTSSSTQAPEMASSSTVISMTLQTPELTHSSPITPTTQKLIKTTPRGTPWTSATKVPPKIGCNATLTAVNGTFQSPNYPRNYPDGQYCFWRITVIATQQIYLIFSSFSLQNENNTDALYVYDGENATGEALEVFYGGYPPPKEGICISSNRIFVVFKSDKAGSYHGFSASYYGVNNSESCAIATSQTSALMLESTSGPSKESGKKDGPSEENGKKDERKQLQGKGLNMVAVVVPVVLAILLAVSLVAGICYIRKRRKRIGGPDEETFFLRERRKRVAGPDEETFLRKRRKRVAGPDEEIYLRFNDDSSASDEDTEL